MKSLQILVIAFVFLQSCISPYKNIDIKEAKQLVQLNTNDLNYFSQLRQQLLNDSIAIRRLYETVAASSNRTEWMGTNSYYLNQIDSSRYKVLFSKLKGKLADDIRINSNGSVIFTIKENVQMNLNDYNETYSHQLVSADCNCPINTVFNNVDTIFVDSAINKD